MKFYPNADVWFYVEKPPGWDTYQKYPPNHSWKLPSQDFKPKVMLHWRDLEGAKLVDLKRKDLYFNQWPKSRIRDQACLGMLYATGYRFIRLTRAPPAGFKCAPMPVNLATAYIVNANLKKLGSQARKEALKAKKEAKEKKAAEKKYKNRAKPRGRN